MTRRILLVEDEPDIARLVELNLSDLGWLVEVCHSGRAGLDRALNQSYDLIILDLMLPDIDGLEVCREIRARPGYPPILMLTARSTELDRVLGLEVGADDYLTKPFSVRELVARLKAIFRRVDAMASRPDDHMADVIAVGGLRIDPEQRTVLVDEVPVSLTAKEFDLLSEFARHPGRVYTRSDLLDRVWGYRHEGYEHTVNSHINRLRSKIEPDRGQPRYIQTVWGVGYRFADPLSAAGS